MEVSQPVSLIDCVFGSICVSKLLLCQNKFFKETLYFKYYQPLLHNKTCKIIRLKILVSFGKYNNKKVDTFLLYQLPSVIADAK